MKREELIKQCRYYRGEVKNPYENGEKVLLWEWERAWVEMALIAETNTKGHDALTLQSYLEEYRNAGMHDFKSMDGTPAELKAVLYKRFSSWDEYSTMADFKQWYNGCYSRN